MFSCGHAIRPMMPRRKATEVDHLVLVRTKCKGDIGGDALLCHFLLGLYHPYIFTASAVATVRCLFTEETPAVFTEKVFFKLAFDKPSTVIGWAIPSVEVSDAGGPSAISLSAHSHGPQSGSACLHRPTSPNVSLLPESLTPVWTQAHRHHHQDEAGEGVVLRSRRRTCTTARRGSTCPVEPDRPTWRRPEDGVPGPMNRCYLHHHAPVQLHGAHG
jgi:hypothetical protein